MEIGVIGAGYVGLTTAACFAHLGHRVTCAEIDRARVEKLNAAQVDLAEPELAALVTDGIKAGRLRFVADAVDTADAEVIFLCVGTPGIGDGRADLSALEDVVAALGPKLRPNAVLVNKSTVPVGSAVRVRELLGDRDDVGVVSNPEFLSEGRAVRDFLKPSRVVIGGDDPGALAHVAELYREMRAPMLVTDSASAEIVKYAANAFLATKVSFVNAMANLCEAVGADVREVGLGLGHDPRIGFEYLEPGPGFGGACLPKDVRALLYSAERAGYDFALLRGVLEVNEEQRDRVVSKVRSLAGGTLDGATVGVLGLTFKAHTDDVRESPALAVINRLLAEGASVQAFDPAAHAVELPVELRHDGYEAARGANVLVVLTEWPEFRSLDYARVASEMRRAAIVDARNLLNPEELERYGFEYVGVGR